MQEKGILYIVATPIGNLEDMTFRAVRILREVDIIAAEDTRHSRKLLSHFSISKPLTSYFDHNKSTKGQYLIDKLSEGRCIALISDAGTPCISDPGYELVRDAIAAGIQVVPVPGPSACIAALSVSGLPVDSFIFEGFLPNRQGRRCVKLATLRHENRLLIFYESPVRLLASLSDMLEILGNRQVLVAREISKVHEEFLRGTLSDVILALSDRRIKGEMLILVSPAEQSVRENALSLQELLIDYLKVKKMSLKDAVKKISVETGLKRGKIYTEALKALEK